LLAKTENEGNAWLNRIMRLSVIIDILKLKGSEHVLDWKFVKCVLEICLARFVDTLIMVTA